MSPAPGRALTALVAVASFVELFDATMVATAGPRIGADLAVSPAATGNLVAAYLVAAAAAMPASGWLADRFGPRRVFTVAVTGFAVCSALCAWAPGLQPVLGARALQGAAGAVMVTVGQLVVLRSTPKGSLIGAIALLTWPALMAPVLAPWLTGITVSHISWRWLFLANIPLAVVAQLLGLRHMPGDRAPRGRLDALGLVLLGTGVAGLSGAASALSAGAPAAGSALVAAAGGGFLAFAIRHMARTRWPLLDLGLFRRTTFRTSYGCGSMFRGAVLAAPVAIVLLLQEGMGQSPVQAGGLVTAVFVGNVAVKPATTPLLRRFGCRAVILYAATGAGLSLLTLTAVTAATPIPALVALLFLGGCFRSVGFTGLNTMAFADVPPEEMSDATTLGATCQHLAAGLSVTAATVVVTALTTWGSLEPLGAYRSALGVLALLCLGTACRATTLPRDVAHAVTSRTPLRRNAVLNN